MPRIARVVATGYPHHITQRGNYKQNTFTASVEYSRYLKWLDEYSRANKLSILAYCLMPNHVHFVAIPEKEDSLAKTFNACHMRHSQYFNKKNGMTGHLWQGRFYSCILGESHLYAAVRYIENNPVRAQLVERAEDWKWSSAKTHLNKDRNILSLAQVSTFLDIPHWGNYLAQSDDDTITAKIRANTLTGRPSGDDTFVLKLEKLLGRRLRPLPVGRPRKEQ
jgi:putative transposase